jgi:hypothetical protein
VLRYLERRGSQAASPVAIPATASAEGVSQQAT